MEKRKPKKVFVEGAIPPEKVATSIASHSSKMDISSYSIYLGQVKQTNQEGTVISGKDFSTDIEASESLLAEIREDAFARYSLTCLHIYHSLGSVSAGQIYLFVFSSSTLDHEAEKATSYLVERIQSEINIKCKEIF